MLKDVCISEVEAEAISFLDGMKLDDNLYHNVFKKDRVELLS